MKVIMLDIDGVLNGDYYEPCTKLVYAMDPEKLALLKQIVDRTGAEIVLSSSWRQREAAVEDIKKELVDAGLPRLIGCTPDLTEALATLGWPNSMGYLRGPTILAWLKSRPVEAYVVLDDMIIVSHYERLQDPDMSDELLRCHIQTNGRMGIMPEDVEKACQILEKDK